MYHDDDEDFLFLDWEYSGIFGNPGIDIATWISSLPSKYIANENQYLEAYWNALIKAGVDKDDYPLDKLIHDYLTYGTVHSMFQWIKLTNFHEDKSYYFSKVENWFELHPTLTPEDMTTPSYLFVDFAGWPV